MSKGKKIALAVAVGVMIILLLGGIALHFALNYHELYVWCEEKGLFCRQIHINNVDLEGTVTYSLDELKNDERVIFDQSLLLVNVDNLLPEGYLPDVLEYKDTTVYMSSCMLDDYARLSRAVTDKTGKKLYVSSDLRTEEEQKALYEADPLTATLPGASEHQTGLALDVYVAYYAGDAFIKSPSGRFVNSHAHEYGFIIRYPAYGEEITGIRYEPWHIRYVGAPHASVIYQNHLTLEEYILSLEIGEWYETDGHLVSRQLVGDAVIMPAEFKSCVISPDNTGCYIITIEK